MSMLGGAAVAWPFAARAQQSSLPVVGFLTSRTRAQAEYLVAALLAGLKEAGFSEGQNVAIDYRYAESHYERLPALAQVGHFFGERMGVVETPPERSVHVALEFDLKLCELILAERAA